MDTPYYFPEGWSNVLNEQFANLDGWETYDQELVYQDTVWLDANNTIREGGGLRQVGSDELVDGKYQGAILMTKNNYHHGFFECYCKLPTGYIWPAFFLYDVRRYYEGAVKNEIDIFEYLGANIVYVTTHLSAELSYQTAINLTGIGGVYHKWGCYWDDDGIVVYLDDLPICAFPPEQMPTATMRVMFQWSFDGWAQPPTNVTFPAYFDVDWVKVWVKDNTHR